MSPWRYTQVFCVRSIPVTPRPMTGGTVELILCIATQLSSTEKCCALLREQNGPRMSLSFSTGLLVIVRGAQLMLILLALGVILRTL